MCKPACKKWPVSVLSQLVSSVVTTTGSTQGASASFYLPLIAGFVWLDSGGTWPTCRRSVNLPLVALLATFVEAASIVGLLFDDRLEPIHDCGVVLQNS